MKTTCSQITLFWLFLFTCQQGCTNTRLHDVYPTFENSTSGGLYQFSVYISRHVTKLNLLQSLSCHIEICVMLDGAVMSAQKSCSRTAETVRVRWMAFHYILHFHASILSSVQLPITDKKLRNEIVGRQQYISKERNKVLWNKIRGTSRTLNLSLIVMFYLAYNHFQTC